jgi:hypothetical protein
MQPCLPARSTLMAHFGNRPEIDHRTIKLIVGGVALGLAPLTIALSPAPIASISASYHEGGAAQSVFVGFLFAIAALLLAYNGLSRTEMILSKGRPRPAWAWRCFRAPAGATSCRCRGCMGSRPPSCS